MHILRYFQFTLNNLVSNAKKYYVKIYIFIGVKCIGINIG